MAICKHLNTSERTVCDSCTADIFADFEISFSLFWERSVFMPCVFAFCHCYSLCMLMTFPKMGLRWCPFWHMTTFVFSFRNSTCWSSSKSYRETLWHYHQHGWLLGGQEVTTKWNEASDSCSKIWFEINKQCACLTHSPFTIILHLCNHISLF